MGTNEEVENDLRMVGVHGRRGQAQDRDGCSGIVDQVKGCTTIELWLVTRNTMATAGKTTSVYFQLKTDRIDINHILMLLIDINNIHVN